jgi:serpin B
MIRALASMGVVGTISSILAADAAATESNPHIQGINALGARVVETIRAAQPNDNLFISGLSLHEAISMLYVGSEGATRAELGTLLGLDGATSSPLALTEAYERLHESLRAADSTVTIEIANSLWANQALGVRFKRDFVALNTRGHQATLMERDFGAAGFTDEVNGWCSEKTRGKITRVLSPPVSRDQLCYLINAIYFKGVWHATFKEDATRDDTFTTAGGDPVGVKMMEQSGTYRYAQNADAELVHLPYGKNERFSMAIYLPRRGSEGSFFGSIRQKARELDALAANKTGTVQLPRFKLEYTQNDMIAVLKSMGVVRVFSDAAELGGIAEGERQAAVNTIIHKALVEVNEEGTEAAAVTVIGIKLTNLAPDDPFTFRADRPFYFEIVDNQTGLVLFSGILNRP